MWPLLTVRTVQTRRRTSDFAHPSSELETEPVDGKREYVARMYQKEVPRRAVSAPEAFEVRTNLTHSQGGFEFPDRGDGEVKAKTLIYLRPKKDYFCIRK